MNPLVTLALPLAIVAGAAALPAVHALALASERAALAVTAARLAADLDSTRQRAIATGLPVGLSLPPALDGHRLAAASPGPIIYDAAGRCWQDGRRCGTLDSRSPTLLVMAIEGRVSTVHFTADGRPGVVHDDY